MKTARPIHCRTLVIIAVAVIATACAGGRQTAPAPPHLTAGIRALQKGDAWYQKGCYPKAIHQYRKAYPELVAGDHLREMGICLNNMGNAYLRNGNPESALAFFDEALDVYRTTGDAAGARAAQTNKSFALMALERYDAAQAALDQARPADSGADTASRLAAEAVLRLRRGETAAARMFLDQALDLPDAQDTATTAVIQFTKGKIAHAGGDLGPAATHYENALRADRRQQYYRGMAEDLKALGDIRAAQGRHADAAVLYKRSISLYALIDDADGVAALRPPLAQSAAAAGQTTDVTLHFVEDWLGNKSFDGPCE